MNLLHFAVLRALIAIFAITTLAQLACADTPTTVPAWKRQIERWAGVIRERRGMVDVEPAKQAAENIRAVRDPLAIKALEELLVDDYYQVQRACLEALSSMEYSTEVLRVWVHTAVCSNREATRGAAVKWIRELNDPEDAIPFFVEYLHSPKFASQATQALVASGLGQRKQSQMPNEQLFKALVTSLVHKERTRRPIYYWEWSRWMEGKKHASHASWGRTLVPVDIPVPNEIVHKTLVDCTGQDFGYNQQAWQAWYNRTKRAEQRQGRRVQ